MSDYRLLKQPTTASHTTRSISLTAFFFALFFFPSFFFFATPTAHAGYFDYSDVLLVVNDNSATSTTIGNYFATARGIASTSIIHLNTVTTESVSRTEFTNNIRTPIENFITSHGITNSTNYIVTTKGVPLMITDTGNSVESELGLILGPYSSDIGTVGTFSNPYYNAHTRFSRANYGVYIVTRLDGYTIAGVESMIDRSANATTTNTGSFVLDVQPNKDGGAYQPFNDQMRAATTSLIARGYNVILDQTTTYLTYQSNLLGYVSWGSNDGSATTTNSIPHNTYRNGAIGETGVSTSARSFMQGTTYGQSLIADWLAEGISAMKGYVSEPFVAALAHADILFDRYTGGYTMADSFFAASAQINWKDEFIGDPKMLIVKTPSAFDISAPAQNAISATQTPTFTWSASDSYNGIAKYQLFVDGVLNKDNITGTSTTPSSNLTAGTHTWYVKTFDGAGNTATSTSTFTLNVVPGYTTPYTFYVDNVLGSDSNPGTYALPWATLAKANITAGGGDTVLVFPLAFDISAPAQNAISATQTPTFTWSASDSYNGIAKYQLFVDGVLNKDNITGTSTTPSSNLTAGTHTWYVKTFDGAGNTATSTSTFTLNVVPGYTTPYTFYVDNVLGSDSNPGTYALPWATLAKAGIVAVAGDTVVIIKNANQPYRETLTPSNSGTASSPITFRGVDAGSKPEIWGSTDVSNGWTVYSSGQADTYQNSYTGNPQIFAAGPTLATLTKRTKGASALALNPGEWARTSSNILYYRLASGETIGGLRMETSTRSSGIASSMSNIAYQNIIVRYTNLYGASLSGTSTSATGVEVYDSRTGFFVGGTDTSLSHLISVRNNTYGLQLYDPINATVYNSTFSGNTNGGGTIMTLANTSAILRNNIFSGNGGYSSSFFITGTPSSITTSNNLWDISGDTLWESTYKGTSNQELVNPLLTNPSASDFTLTQLSPAIDTGTPVSGRTTDILGNPIYGTPDIGPYEYQPPYTIGTNSIQRTGNVRVYANGKYRYTTATSSAATATLTVTPVGGFGSGNYAQWMDIAINTWDTSGDFKKVWTESSPMATSTAHTVGDLASSTAYGIAVDGTFIATSTTNSSGSLSFTYTGGYTTHTFTVANDAPAAFTLSSPSDGTNGSVTTLSWNPSSDSWDGLSTYALYIDGSLTSSVSSSATSASAPSSLACNTAHHWYVVATDQAGQTTTSNTDSFTIPCGGIAMVASVSAPTSPAAVITPPTAASTTPAQTVTAPASTHTSSLTGTQVSAILQLLTSFGADPATITKVKAALTGTPTSTSTTTCTFTRNLTMKSSGSEVSCLQSALLAKGYKIPAGPTGYFGGETRAAVRAWQKAVGIQPAQGYFGSISRKAIVRKP
ncbi:MAG: TIGR03790 family protein [Minisyncoccota bacterium]